MKQVHNAATTLLVISLITFCTGILYGADGALFILSSGFMVIPALVGMAVTNSRLTNVIKDYNIMHEAFRRLRVAVYGILASLVMIAAGMYVGIDKYGWVIVTIGVLSILMHISVLWEHRRLFRARL